MNHMLGSLKVFPQFARYLQSFGIKDFAQDEGFSGFDFKAKWDSHGDLGVVESCYHLKYAEMHGDAGTFYNPWSVRQAAIYQRFDIKTGSNDCILIRLSDCMRDDLGEFLRRPDQPRPFKMDWDCIHLLAVASLTAGWRKYINYLDREVSKMFDTVIVSQVDPKKVEEKGLAETALNYMKRLQYLMDQIARTQHMLALNIKVMQMMRVRSTQIPELLAHERKEVDASNLDIVLESNIADHEFASLNAGSLWARASILSNQLRDTISFQNGESMKAITRSTNEGNQALFGLSAKAMIETRTMKVLAILGTIFVPASFVADLLQTGYINVLQTSGFAVSATKGLWLYFSIAAPLIMATMMVFLYSEVLNRRRLAKTLAMEQSEFA
ncbi:hypothetical protein MMC25_000915 [Agyrium rufum]|nr:hypothetical protein [Agyrium rufum]